MQTAVEQQAVGWHWRHHRVAAALAAVLWKRCMSSRTEPARSEDCWLRSRAYGSSWNPYYSYYYPDNLDGKPSLKQPIDPRNQIKTGHWTTGLFSCFESCVPNCLITWVCLCVSLAQVYARVGLVPYSSALVYFGFFYLLGWLGYGSLAFSSETTMHSNFDDIYTTTPTVPEAVSICMMASSSWVPPVHRGGSRNSARVL